MSVWSYLILGLAMTGAFSALQRLTLRPPRFLVAALTRNRRLEATDANR
ncbi:MAG: hypothetical protein U1F44_03290 [Coriobacteriia bacterium]|nr:hypothetical protein [Coriobacteriia bacterium]